MKSLKNGKRKTGRKYEGGGFFDNLLGAKNPVGFSSLLSRGAELIRQNQSRPLSRSPSRSSRTVYSKPKLSNTILWRKQASLSQNTPSSARKPLKMHKHNNYNIVKKLLQIDYKLSPKK